MKNNTNQINQNFNSSGDEIDLRFLLNFFVRNKFLIGSFSILFLVLFSLYSFTLKKVWQGQFQIVLNTNSEKKGVNISSSLSDFVELPQENDLNTQVAILESPSLLEPIFRFVVSRKQKKDSNFDMSFSNWKNNNLNISLKKNTSVLNISYEDQDKELIIPLLEKMTYAYQEYSGKNKRRIQELTKNYLKDQIDFFKEKSSLSLKAAQDFAIEQDLSFQLNNFAIAKEELSEAYSLTNVDIENIRVKAANELRIIDNTLKKLEELNDSEELQYIGSTIPALVAEGLPQTLKDIESQLVEMRSKYTEKDINIINLLEKRRLSLTFLKDRTIKYLKAYKLDVEARMEAAMRPKGVILNYKELIREASRDESTLISLENQLRRVELEQAKTEDPWELITKPNLTTYPIAPSKTKIGFFGLIMGFLIGTITCFYKEKKSDLVFEFKLVEGLLNTKVLEKLKIEDLTSDSEKIIFIQSLFAQKKYNKIFLLYLDTTEKQKFDNLIKLLKENYDNPEQLALISLKELKQVSKNDGLFLTTSLGALKFSQIYKLRQRMAAFDLKVDGIILS